MRRWLAKLAGKTGGDVVDAIAGTVDRFVRTADEKAAMRLVLARMAAERDALQIEVAKLEATGTWFQRGWRPSVGWTCALALAWHFVGAPFTIFGLEALGLAAPALPELEWAALSPILLGMLGLGALRTYEVTAAADGRSRRR